MKESDVRERPSSLSQKPLSVKSILLINYSQFQAHFIQPSLENHRKMRVQTLECSLGEAAWVRGREEETLSFQQNNSVLGI